MQLIQQTNKHINKQTNSKTSSLILQCGSDAESFPPLAQKYLAPSHFCGFQMFCAIATFSHRFPKVHCATHKSFVPSSTILLLPNKCILNSDDSAQNVLKWKKVPLFLRTGLFWLIYSCFDLSRFLLSNVNFLQYDPNNNTKWCSIATKLQLCNVAFHIEKISKTLSQIWYTHHMSSAVVKCDTMERYIRGLVWPTRLTPPTPHGSYHIFSS